MARKNLNRGLGALAALGALSYHLSRSGGRSDGGAPVDDRNIGGDMPSPEADAAMGARIQRGAAGPNGGPATGDQGDTGDFLSRRLRVNPETGQAYSMDNLSPMGGGGGGGGARSPAGPAALASMSAAAMDGGYANRPPAPSVGSGRSGGQGGPTAAELAAYEQSQRNEAMRGRGYNRAPAPSVGGGRSGGQGGPTAAEMEAYRNRPYSPPLPTPEMRRQAERQAISPVYPEEYLAGGPGLKSIHSAAKALAGRTTGRSTAPYLKELGAPPRQGALPPPQGRISGPSKSDLTARDRASREAARREEMLRENAEAYGLNPNAPGYEAAARALREKLGNGAFTLKKKGGAVKTKKMASGGMTSASKRGDGIASKGKTKCKMY